MDPNDDPVTQILNDPRFSGQPITWEATPETYDKIRHDWLTHVSSEEKLFTPPITEGEFEAEMKTMMSVFTDDCVMELVETGERWDGQGGAKEFYRTFLSSFTAMQWHPLSIVVGPQGVLDVANMTSTLLKPFAGFDRVGDEVNLQWVIHFPWVQEAGKFSGETVYSIRALSTSELS